MNAMKKPSFLPCIALIFGAAAFGLRKCLYAFAVDQRGLLVSGHPLTYGLWAVVLLCAAFLLWQVRKHSVCEYSFAPSAAAAAGSTLLAVGLLMTVLHHTPSGTGTIALLWKILGFLSAPALTWAGISRRKGQKPFFGVHGLLCLFLLVHMICRYQVWSGNPQLQDYIFQLLAAISLTLFSYYCAAFEADMGSPRMHLGTGLLAVLLCTVALSEKEYRLLYLCGLVWVFAELCARNPLPKEEVNTDAAS